MQQYNINTSIRNTLQTANGASSEPQPAGMPVDMQEAARAAERARLRQGIMHVRIRHFYCTLEEMFDPSLRGQSFVVGTGTGRPNEPGRVIDASPAAVRLGVSPGMPLRRAHRIAPRTRFLPLHMIATSLYSSAFENAIAPTPASSSLYPLQTLLLTCAAVSYPLTRPSHWLNDCARKLLRWD